MNPNEIPKASIVKLKRRNNQVVQGCDIYISKECFRGGWQWYQSQWFPLHKWIHDSDLKNEIYTLIGQELGCWCPDVNKCHGKIILHEIKEFLSKYNDNLELPPQSIPHLHIKKIPTKSFRVKTKHKTFHIHRSHNNIIIKKPISRARSIKLNSKPPTPSSSSPPLRKKNDKWMIYDREPLKEKYKRELRKLLHPNNSCVEWNPFDCKISKITKKFNRKANRDVYFFYLTDGTITEKALVATQLTPIITNKIVKKGDWISIDNYCCSLLNPRKKVMIVLHCKKFESQG